MHASPLSALVSPLAHPRFSESAGGAATGIATPLFRAPVSTSNLTPYAASDAEPENSGGIAKSARHLVRHALRDFRHEIKDTLSDLGFGREEIADIVKGVMEPLRDALKSGQSFGAQLMVAAATQVSCQGNGVQAQQFNLAVDALEIQYNHDTGEVTVTRLSVDIEAKSVATGGAPAPQLFDIDDSANALPDLSDILKAVSDIFDLALPADEAEDAEPAPIPAPATEAAPLASERVALTEPAAPVAEPAAEDVAPAEEVAQTKETAPVAPAERSRSYARVSVDLFEQFVNAQGQTISRLRLNALIPLDARAADVPVPALPVDAPAPAADSATGPISIQA